MSNLRKVLLLGVVTCVSAGCHAGDIQPPSVSISGLLNGASLSGIVNISVTATDNVSVASVSLKLDGANLSAPLTNAPFLWPLNTSTLPNGVHSLLAVAADAVGNFARSPVITISVTNPPAYTLSKGPFVVQNLGSALSVNTQERQAFFTLSNKTHLLLYYIANYGVNPIQILDVNLSDATARLTNGVAPGRPGIRGTVLYPNGKIYQATGQANGKGYFLEYDPTTGATRQIAQTTGLAPGQYSEIGDDGWIYIGEYPYGYVDRYNPTTDVFQSLGMIDPNASVGTYAYTLGADSRYLYVGVGQNPMYLAVYDTQTAQRTLYFGTSTNGTDNYAAVRHGTNGGWYYEREGPATGNVLAWYALSNGVPSLMSTGPKDLLVENAQRGNVVDGINNGPLVGYNINMDYALPDSTGNDATIGWQKVGTTNWQSATAVNFGLCPVGVSRLYPLSPTKLLGFSSFYGPVVIYDTVQWTATSLGYPQCNLYDAAMSADTYYFCGYTATQLRFNPLAPWTLVSSTPNMCAASVNPCQTPLAIGKHEYYTTFGADGMVYVAAIHERDSAGGELGWYDPLTGMSGSLRNPFLYDEPADLKPALGGTKLVYASTGTNLFVFDVATKSIQRIIVPLPGVTLDKVVEVSPGIMLGVAGSNVFKVDITTGSITYSSTLPGKAFQESQGLQDRRLCLAPNGFIWMFRYYRDFQNFNRSSLYRINPADCSYSVMFTNTYYTYGENNVMFNGGNMYWYGGQNLYWVNGILTQ